LKVRLMNKLDTNSIRFDLSDVGLLKLTIEDGTAIEPVHCVSLFPLSDPEEYVSVVREEDGEDNEIGIIERLSDLPRGQRDLVKRDIARRYFLPEIVDVRRITTSGLVDEWDVVTDKGPKVFHVSGRKENFTISDDNTVIITDVEKCRYRITNYRALKPRARLAIDRVLP